MSPTSPTSPDVPREHDRLVDFPSLAQRLFWTAVIIAAAAVAGATLHGLLAGLTFAVLAQWALIGLVVFVMAAAVVAAAHAVGGARAARDRGEALSSDDVGLRPYRLDERGVERGRPGNGSRTRGERDA